MTECFIFTDLSLSTGTPSYGRLPVYQHTLTNPTGKLHRRPRRSDVPHRRLRQIRRLRPRGLRLRREHGRRLPAAVDPAHVLQSRHPLGVQHAGLPRPGPDLCSCRAPVLRQTYPPAQPVYGRFGLLTAKGPVSTRRDLESMGMRESILSVGMVVLHIHYLSRTAFPKSLAASRSVYRTRCNDMKK